MRTTLSLVAALLVALPVSAQERATISPGMSRSQVVEAFGSPTATRQAGEWTYLFYLNRCLPGCGSDDVVFLQGDRVVAAVLRSPARRFAGPAAAPALAGASDLTPASPGPRAAPPSDPGARRAVPTDRPGVSAPVEGDGRATVGGIRITVPGDRGAGQPGAAREGAVVGGDAIRPGDGGARPGIIVGADTVRGAAAGDTLGPRRTVQPPRVDTVSGPEPRSRITPPVDTVGPEPSTLPPSQRNP